MKWMEEARIGCLDSIGLPFRQIEEEGIVTEAAIDGYTGVRLEVPYVRIVPGAEPQSSGRNDFAATKNSMGEAFFSA